MADLALGNRTELKRHLLAAALRDQTGYDDVIDAIGRGVAATFDKFCNRTFARAAGATFECTADRTFVILPRYPVETLTSVKYKAVESDEWTTESDLGHVLYAQSGLVAWNYIYAEYPGRLLFTFTGGYWYDTTEDSSGSLPTGATSVPYDVKLSWFMQCKHVWQHYNPTGSAITARPADAPALDTVELMPAVIETLRGYVRAQL